jgi:hypothetical protein
LTGQFTRFALKAGTGRSSNSTSPSGDQIEDQNDQRHHQEQMNQAASDMKTEAQ